MSQSAIESTDVLIHCLAADGALRAVAATTTGLAEEARWRHDLYPTAAAALGRTLTAAALLGATLKDRQELMIQFTGDGPLGQVLASAEPGGSVRGFVHHPHVHLPLNAVGKLDVAGAVGRGFLHITKRVGFGEPYRGTVPIVSGEIAEDIAYYLLNSEQTPSIVALGVLVERDNRVRAAGGLLAQIMPGGDDALAAELEARARELPAISRLVDDGVRPLDVLERLLGPLGLRVVAERPLRYACSCSKERFASGLAALGVDELRDIIEEQGEAELVCHFCGEVYCYGEHELQALIAETTRPLH